MVLHQATRAQLQAVRSLAHRAAHTMETWRVATGSRQITELFYYFSTFVDCVARSVRANEVLLAFVRASSAACATWAGALAAAAATLEPLSTGELMSSPAGGSAAAAAAAAAASAAAAAAAAPGGGAGGALSPSRIALGIEKPQLPSLGQLTRQLQVLQGALCTLGGDLAASISKMLAGDADGPLGRHAGGSSARRLAQGASESSAPPGDMASLTAWYSACASDLKDKGSALGAQLTEAQGQCEKAYAELDGLCSAHLSGDPRRVASVKGRCLWAAELRYRRACRALLGVKSRYLAHMAALFEKFRGVEAARSEAMGACLEAYSCLIARSFERAGGGGGGGGSSGGGAAGGAPNGVPALAQALNTHQDLCRVVDAEARVKILELRQAAERAGLVGGGAGGSAAGAGAVGAAAAAAAQAELAQSPAEQHQLLHTVYREAALSSVAAAASAAPGAAAGAAAAPVTFRLDPAPAVISPLASPLVLRCGMLYRQSGIVKAWKPVVGAFEPLRRRATAARARSTPSVTPPLPSHSHAPPPPPLQLC